MANENATWRDSMSLRCATPAETAIVPWYWFGADINATVAGEDDRDFLKTWIS
jgi:hypothetical protein